jgi:calcium-dependent protein kinase
LAVKTIQKSRVEDVEQLHREISILASVDDHPHIIKLYDVYEDAANIHIVTELCTGGELYDKVIEKAESPEGHFREEDAAILIRDILDAIRYCHDVVNIVHRDLKPENFLLKNESDDAPVKIIDFGLSRRDDAPFGVMQSRVGTYIQYTHS